MVLESLRPNTPINVRDLTIDAPKQLEISPFDPEAEITQDDWTRIMSDLTSQKFFGLASGWEYLPGVLVLDPAKREELGQEILRYNRIYRAQAFATEEEARRTEPWPISPDQYFSCMRIVDPQDLPANLRTGDIRDIERRIPTLNLIDTFINKLIIPQLNTNGLSQSRVSSVLTSRREAGINEYFKSVAIYRVLLPSRKFNIAPDDWKKARLALVEERSKDNMFEFVKLAKDMKIAAAKSAEVTRDGLQITMLPKAPDFTNSTPPLPEMRRF